MFRDVCKVINSTLNLEEVLNLITENIVNALNLKGCTVFLLDKERNRLEVSASYGVSKAYLQKGPLDADKSIAETLNGESVLIYDTTTDSRIQYPQEAKKEGIASIFSVPISVKGQVIGVLRIYTSQRKNVSSFKK
jgi:signal transduction protein with GAF and PtsI domain